MRKKWQSRPPFFAPSIFLFSPSNNYHSNTQPPASLTVFHRLWSPFFGATTMKFFYTIAGLLAGLASAGKLPEASNAGQVTSTIDLLALADVAPAEHHRDIDLHSPKYHLSECTRKYLWHIGGILTGYTYNDVHRKYTHCAYVNGGASLFDWACLCKGGDGEGSAIIDMAVLNGHVWNACGWDYSFGMPRPSLSLSNQIRVLTIKLTKHYLLQQMWFFPRRSTFAGC